MPTFESATLGSEATLPEAMRGTVTLSVDVEDWHQLVGRRLSGHLRGCSSHVEAQMDRVLALLDEHRVRGTFFVLGLVAREKPDLVRRIASHGHEVASHGIGHVPLHQLDVRDMRADVVDSRKLLSDVIGQDVVGFRAPEFSIVEQNSHVLGAIAEAGYRYDSSIVPVLHRRYGIRWFARGPVCVNVGGRTLWELPLATLRTPVGNVPVGGGGYFRLLPGAVLEPVMRSIARRGEHAMLYFHPYEFTEKRLTPPHDTMPRSRRARTRATVWFTLQAVGRTRLPARVERVLRFSRSVRAVDLVDALESNVGNAADASGRPHDVHTS